MRNQFLSLSGFVHPLRTGAFGAVEFQPSASQPACLHRRALAQPGACAPQNNCPQQGTAGQGRTQSPAKKSTAAAQ